MILKHKIWFAFLSFILFSFLIVPNDFMNWEATPQESGRIVYIKESKISLKETIKGKTIAELLLSTPVSVIEKKNGWIKVQLTGWIPEGAVVSDLIEVSKPISITLKPSSSNRNEHRKVEGKVINADPNLHKVLVYVKTDILYLQYYCDDRGNHKIASNGTWKTRVHPGRIYAYVVAMDYNPLCELNKPLKVDGKRVLAKVVEK